MKNFTPHKISISAAGSIAVGLLLILFLIQRFIQPELSLWIIFFIPAITFLSGQWIINFFFERFIFEKIKLIYKIINPSQPNSGELKNLNPEAGILNQVEKDARNWEGERRKELTKLRDMETYRREFVGNVSHELKTPLFNIQGYLETLIEGGLEDDKINIEYLRKAQKNVYRLGTIIADLEMISRFENDKIQLVKQKFNITELIKETFETIEMQAEFADIKLILNDDQAYMVFADRKAISQVMINLVSNSIKYGKENGKTEVSIYDMHENMRIEIKDDGIGIESKHLPRLFERFYRIDNNRSRVQGGTGLGLSIVKHILEAHNQIITVSSTPKKETTFGFTLQKA